MTAYKVLLVQEQDLQASVSISSSADKTTAASTLKSISFSVPGIIVEPEAAVEKSAARTKVNNTVIAPACAVFSNRASVSVNACPSPFGPGETGAGGFGDDDGVRVQLKFSVNFMVHLGTYVNGTYHPKGTCNGRRLFCRSLGGGGTPHLFLYYLPDRDCWAVGLYPGDGEVYAVCGPAGDEPLRQTWQVWDGQDWTESPVQSASVVYKSDQQTARWEDQASSHHKVASAKKAQHEIRHKMYKYAERGAMRPLLEKGGILQEHAVLLSTDLAFEADQSLADEPCKKLAWDIKIIDAKDVTNVNRYSAQDHSPLGLADACRNWCVAYNDRGRRCAQERSWRYDPLVFTIQGHISPEAENAISLLSVAVARVEKVDVNALRAEMVRSLVASLPS